MILKKYVLNYLLCIKLCIKLSDGQNRSDSISILHFDNKIYFKYFEK